MYFYEVFVAEPRYQKPEPLTYSSELDLPIGSVVDVPYGKKIVSGFVHSRVEKPGFKTKPIELQITQHQIPAKLIDLHGWMLDHYPYGSGSVTQLFIPSSLSKTKLKPAETIEPKVSLPPLTKQQAEAYRAIDSSKKNSFLLHGETGSGKTRLYLERARKHLAAGSSVIILTPEISLVPQLLETFRTSVGVQTVEIHSGMTKSNRNRSWMTALASKEPVVVVGTRSAIFAPLRNIGLIVVDEMHEPAYKQDSAPRYHALRAAAKRAQLSDSEIIYGSATPGITEYFLAEQTGAEILRLTETAKASEKPECLIIDIKDKKQFSRHSYLSDQLIESIDSRLRSKEQSMLFLNRRGTARQILCQKCGWQALCPKCDLPLTLHADTHQVRCHTCGYHNSPPYECPVCKSSDIVYRSLGTKALADDLQKLFPEARIKRFDTDNLAADSLARQYKSVHAGEVDILVGTQMLGKGLDLPKLSLVGIVNADTALHMPDFSSAERGYQLLHQAIGRVGRGHRRGKVIIQTFQTNDVLIQAAARQDWHSLYEHELQERETFMFPPYCYLLKIVVSRKSSRSAENFIGKLAAAIKELKLPVEIQEPAPSFYERSHGSYNWQLVIKARNRKTLAEAVLNLPAGDYTYDLDPINLL